VFTVTAPPEAVLARFERESVESEVVVDPYALPRTARYLELEPRDALEGR
jgi:hypothetical protein